MKAKFEYLHSKPPDEVVTKGSILLGHAMYTTFSYFERPSGKSLVDYLTKNGFHVVAFNLTGYGKSAPATRSTNFDSYVEDYQNFIDEYFQDLPEPYFYLGHSVGSLAGLSAFAKSHFPLKKAVLLAPAIWTKTYPARTTDSLKQNIKLKLAGQLCKLLGYLPSKLLSLGDVNAPKGYIDQFITWSYASDVSHMTEPLSYPSLWSSAHFSTLILKAPRDSSMAPSPNIEWVARAIGPKSTVKEVNKANFGYDAEHFSIIYGKDAAQKVWPHLIKFFED